MAKMKNNIFNTLPRVKENWHAYAVRDGFPVANGHTLIVPKREGATFKNLSNAEVLSCYHLMREVIEDLELDSYNIGVNQGVSAGQTVSQLHFHVIPRFEGDVDNPRGGVRHVIPGKGDYLTEEFKIGDRVIWNTEIKGTIVDITRDCQTGFVYEVRFPDHTNHKDVIADEEELERA